MCVCTVNLCSNPDDKLQIYRDNFEKAYMDSTERFYRTQAPAYLQQNGVQNYMKYVSWTRCCAVVVSAKMSLCRINKQFWRCHFWFMMMPKM